MKNKLFTFFWKGSFSQWHMSTFKEKSSLGIIEYCCAEQYMMAKKALLFNDYLTYDKIMASKNPKEIKDLGRLIFTFDQEKWDKVKFSIVYRGNVLKFNQNTDLLIKLFDTGNTILVEASPYDKVWGIGMSEDNLDTLDMNKWEGENLLGKALTSVRDYLRASHHMKQYNMVLKFSDK